MIGKKEYLLNKIKKYEGLNKYIVRNAKLQLAKLDKQPEEVEVKKVKAKKVLSKQEIFDLTKEEQKKIIKGFGFDKVPKLEKNRVELILANQ